MNLYHQILERAYNSAPNSAKKTADLIYKAGTLMTYSH